MITEQMKSEATALAILTDADEAYYLKGDGFADVWYGDSLSTIPVVERLVNEAKHIEGMFNKHKVKIIEKRRGQ